MKKLILSIAILVILVACASVAEGPPYLESRATKNRKGYAIMYVYRQHAEPVNWAATVHIDESPVAKLIEGSFTWAYVKPGERNVTAIWPGIANQKESRISLKFHEGKTYYINLTGSYRAMEASNTLYFKIGTGMNGVRPETATQILYECCRFKAPVSSTY